MTPNNQSDHPHHSTSSSLSGHKNEIKTQQPPPSTLEEPVFIASNFLRLNLATGIASTIIFLHDVFLSLAGRRGYCLFHIYISRCLAEGCVCSCCSLDRRSDTVSSGGASVRKFPRTQVHCSRGFLQAK